MGDIIIWLWKYRYIRALSKSLKLAIWGWGGWGGFISVSHINCCVSFFCMFSISLLCFK